MPKQTNSNGGDDDNDDDHLSEITDSMISSDFYNSQFSHSYSQSHPSPRSEYSEEETEDDESRASPDLNDLFRSQQSEYTGVGSNDHNRNKEDDKDDATQHTESTGANNNYHGENGSQRVTPPYYRGNSGDKRIDYTPYAAAATATTANIHDDGSLKQSSPNPFETDDRFEDESETGDRRKSYHNDDDEDDDGETSETEEDDEGPAPLHLQASQNGTTKRPTLQSMHSTKSSFTTYTEGESWKSCSDDSSSTSESTGSNGRNGRSKTRRSNSGTSRSNTFVDQEEDYKEQDEELLLRDSQISMGVDSYRGGGGRGRSTKKRSIHIDESSEEEDMEDDGGDHYRRSVQSLESEGVVESLKYASAEANRWNSNRELVEDYGEGIESENNESERSSSRHQYRSNRSSDDGSYQSERWRKDDDESGDGEDDELVSVSFGQDKSREEDFRSEPSSAAKRDSLENKSTVPFVKSIDDEDGYPNWAEPSTTWAGGNDEESLFTGASAQKSLPQTHRVQQRQQDQEGGRPPTSKRKQKQKQKSSKKAFYIVMIVSILTVSLGLAAFIYFWFLPYLNAHNEKKNLNNEMWALPPLPSPPKSPDSEVLISPVLDENAPCAYFTMSLVTDSYGNETRWELLYYGDEEDAAGVGVSSSRSDENDASQQHHVSLAFSELNIMRNREEDAKDKRKRLRQHDSSGRRTQGIEPAVIALGGPYDYVNTNSPTYDPEASSHTASICLPKGNYKFILQDWNGDGLCCQYGMGAYGLYFNGGRDVRPMSPAEFLASDETQFQVTEEDIILANTSTSPSISLAPSVSGRPSGAPSTHPTYPADSLLSVQTLRSIDTLSGVSKSYGLLFDIETNSNISSLNIVGMELLVDAQGPVEYEIWTKNGSRHELDLEDPYFYREFFKVSEGTINGTGVCETCGFSSIPLDQFQDVVIEGWKTRQAFWISLKQNSLVFEVYNADKDRRDLEVIPQMETPEFSIWYGNAVLYQPINLVNPQTDFKGTMGFLGKVWYQAKFMNESDHPSSSLDLPLSTNSTSDILSSNTSSYFPDFNQSAQGNSSLSSGNFLGLENGTNYSYAPTYTPSPSALASSSSWTTTPTYHPSIESTTTIKPAQNYSSEEILTMMSNLSYPYEHLSTFQGNLAPSRFGSSIAISTDGKVLAIGAMGAINGYGLSSGAVYIYSIESDVVNGTLQTTWLQTLDGESTGEEFGSSIAMCQFGNHIVVGSRSESGLKGAMRVYQRSNNTWTIQGDPIFGPAESGQAGWSVAISGDAQFITMGIPKDGGGSVMTFKYGLNETNEMAWMQYGNPVRGLSSGEATGYSIALSHDGRVMAVGSPKASMPRGSTFSGKTSVYSNNGTDWVLAQELFGESSEDIDGSAVALSSDGNFLVVGGKGKDDNSTSNVGYCRIFELTETSFGTASYSLIGKMAEERIGSFVAISPDSSTIACGGVNGNFEGLSYSGVVRVFNRVTQQESTIWPRATNISSWDSALFGSSIAMSSDGRHLVIGAPGWSDGSIESVHGSVQIFNY